MRKIKGFLAGLCLVGLLVTGCTAGAEENNEPEESGAIHVKTSRAEEDNGSEGEETVISLKIVDGAGTGNLVLAGEGRNDIYTLSVGDIPVYLDGEPAAADVLEDGMTAEISYGGYVMETWPAQLGGVARISVYSRGTEKNPGGTAYDLSGLYLQVLRDLWDTDPGLNGEITYISVDLSDAPGDLTEGEKTAIAWIFTCEQDADMLTLSYKELVAQGYCEDLNWEDGVLFCIYDDSSDGNVGYSLPVIHFNAEKWRSGLGAYFFQDCQAVWPEMGTWSGYTVGAEAIS